MENKTEWGNDGAYVVVINHEEQYSIWYRYKPLPRGWQEAGPTGGREFCLNWIKNQWSDLLPLSVRRAVLS